MELVFANTSVTLDPGADRVIVMDLPYLQKLATLLSDTKPVVVGKLLGILKLLDKIQSIILSCWRTIDLQLLQLVIKMMWSLQGTVDLSI